MTQDEIRKLLGGYATNTLSADERRILFEAALEDQELFNAIEKEDALRELLDDPVSREQVRRALATGSDRAPGFWSRRWMLGVAAPAAIAVVLIVLINRARAPEAITQPVQVATQRLPSPENATPDAVSQALPDKLEKKKGAPVIAEERSQAEVRVGGPARPGSTAAVPAFAPPGPGSTEVPARGPARPEPTLVVGAQAPEIPGPPPVIPAPIRVEAARAADGAANARYQIAAPVSVSETVRQQLTAAAAGSGTLYQGPLVQYSLIRDAQDAGAVRVEVTTSVGGYLALYELDKTGGWERVYPANDAATPVMAGMKLLIPGNPIRMADSGGKLRLIVVPPAPAKAIGQLGGAIAGAADSADNAKQAVDATLSKPGAAAGAPLVVEIPLRL